MTALENRRSARIRQVPDLSHRRKVDLLAYGFLTLLCVILFADVLFGQRDFFIRDLTRYYHPTKSILREVVLSGEFPWWNPYYSAGQPMAANPEYEVFYPLQWLILLPDFELGYRLHILVHILLSALGMYALLRSMRRGEWASLFGATAWGFGGLSLSLINLLPILFAVAWMPLILLFARRCLRRFTFRDAAAVSVFGGLQILVGEPTTLVQTWLIVGLFALWRIVRLRSRGWRAVADPVAIVLLILGWSIAIGSIQLIPAIDHAGDTVRSRGFDYDLVTAWSFPPQRTLELVYPHLFGRMDVDGRTVYWSGSGLYARPASPFLFSIYLGSMMFALVGAGLLTKHSGRARWASFVSPFFLLALGGHTPLFRWVIDLGVRIPFRYPEKFMVSVLFGTVIFGSLLFDRIVDGDRALAKRALWIMTTASIVATVVGLVSLSPVYGPAFSRLWGVETSKFRNLMISASRTDWIIAAVVTAVSALLLHWRSHGRGARTWGALATAFLVIELVPVGLDASPRIQRSFYDAPSLVEMLSPERDQYRIFHEVDWYGRSKTARKWFSTGRGVYWVVRNGMFPMTPANYGFRSVLERDYDRTLLLPTVDLVRSMWDVRDGGQRQWASIFMRMSNARYRARYRDFDSARGTVADDLRKVQPIEMREAGPSPRYYLADRLVEIEDREDFVAALVKEVPGKRVAFVNFEPFDPVGGSVTVRSETSSSVSLNVQTEGRAFLVISMTPHKYWKAEVDGAPAELHSANIGYQGLILEKGVREVTLRYRNPVVPAMAPISLSALLAALLFFGSRFGTIDQNGLTRRWHAESQSRPNGVDQHSRGVAPD